MVRAIWNGAVIAQSDHTEVVDGNHYFPPDSVNRELVQPSDTTSVCGWKGTANYDHVVAEGQTNKDAAWYYPSPKEAASNIKGHVAFWRGIEVV